MKIRYVLLLAAFLVLSVAGHAQTHRQFHAGQLVLDNDSTTLYYYTIKTPDGMTVSDTFSLPIPPPNNPPSGFVFMGNNINDILQWKVDPILYPMGAWVPTSLDSTGSVKGLGTGGQVTYWVTGDSVSGNNNFLWDTTNFTLTVGDGSSNQHLAVNGAVDATGTEAINSGVWDLAVTGDIAATGIIKSGAGIVIDGVNVPHTVSADQPLTVTTTTGGLTLSTTDVNGVVQVGNTTGTSTNVSIGQSNTVTGGDGATAIGYNNFVSGVSAVALGQSNQATNSQAIAMGTSATASGQFAVALGQGPTASNQGAVAMGQGTKATGPAAVAMGELNVASGWGSLAMGFQTNAVGNFSGVIGNADTANGTGSMAFGQNLTATGTNSIVMGNSATANNSGSFVFSDGSARAFDNGADQFVALASGGVTFYTNSAQTFYMKMDNSGVLQNTSGNTIFPGGSQGVGGQAINWSIPNPGYALSVTNTSGASTGGDGVGIFVADNTSSSYALNVGSNLTGQLFSVRGDGLVAVSKNLDVDGQFQMNNTTVMHQFGTQNIFVGASSGNQTMTGAQNAGFGVATLTFNTTGGANTAIGYTALQLNTTGGSNTAVGGSAMFENLSGVQNTAMGLNALFNNTSGGNNTAIGAGAMTTNTTGNNNTALGQGADVQGNVSNAMALGSGATVSTNNTIQLGNSSITDVSTSGTLHVPQIDNNGNGVTVNDNVTLAKATSVATTSDGSGNYNVGASDFMITETAAGTVNLPAANAKAGRVLVIYNASGAVVTVTPGAGDTIAGGANVVLNTTGNSVTLISDGGTNWVAAGGW